MRESPVTVSRGSPEELVAQLVAMAYLGTVTT